VPWSANIHQLLIGFYDREWELLRADEVDKATTGFASQQWAKIIIRWAKNF
jgi:hypothetical protein